jgi:hypothetical protein
METIDINQFAGFKEASMDTGPITLLIGPQASGKSVTAKLLFFFREIGFQIQNAAIAGTGIEDFKTESKRRFCRYFPPDSWPPKNFSIIYKIKKHKICIEYSHIDAKPPGDCLAVTFTAFYEELLVKFSKRWSELASGLQEGDAQQRQEVGGQFRKELSEAQDDAFGYWSRFQQIFIPAGRAFFSLLEASVFRTLESGQDLDPFLVSFGAFLEESKGVLYERRLFKNRKETSGSMLDFQRVLASVMTADFKRVKKHDSLHYPDGRSVRLGQASSGQQEALPLLLILGRFLSLSHLSGRSVYIEEPEAHLFPATQRIIVEFMARTYRARRSEMCLVITTHSPYILTALNNLLQAGRNYSSSPDADANKKLTAIIPPSHSLNPSDVKAYSLEDGGIKTIICQETSLIDAEIIDNVSSDIAVQFDKLLDTL